MAVNGLQDQDRLDRASNFVVWKARILSLLDRNRVKYFALRTIAIPVDPADNNRYEDAMARAKSIILDRVPDQVASAYLRAEEDATGESIEVISIA